jgi:hypothetical protein
MTENTKSLLKSTILGLLGGGAVSALYSLNSQKNESSSDPEFVQDEIKVPLSRRNFLKAVRPERILGSTRLKKITSEDQNIQIPDTSTMSPKDLAALKKSLLKKKADSCGSSKIKNVTSPSSHESAVRNIAGAGSTFLRDKKGRFKSEDNIGKEAGIISGTFNKLTGGSLDDAGATFNDSLGLIGGTAAGLALTKMISDRIMINKKKKQVEEARRIYVDKLSKEVNDEDLPYYNKTAEDRGLVGSTLGLLGLTGLGIGTTAGIVMYRIMENRRKAIEKEKDKDLSKYPTEKTINFMFPKDSTMQKRSFFAQRRRQMK